MLTIIAVLLLVLVLAHPVARAILGVVLLFGFFAFVCFVFLVVLVAVQ